MSSCPGPGGGGAYLIGCPVSQSPVPETWSLFDFELLMELLQSEIEQDSSYAPTLVPLSVSFSASLRVYTLPSLYPRKPSRWKENCGPPLTLHKVTVQLLFPRKEWELCWRWEHSGQGCVYEDGGPQARWENHT